MTAAPPEKPGRYQRSASGMVGAMVLLVVLVGGFVAVQALGRDHDVEPVRTVDYRPVAQQARTARTLFVFTPDPMPAGWRATSVSYVPGRAPSWHLGMLTDQGSYVGIEESLATERDVVEIRRPRRRARRQGAAAWADLAGVDRPRRRLRAGAEHAEADRAGRRLGR